MQKDDVVVNYNNSENWLSLPSANKDVDVFYVYPTVSNNITGAMDINDPAERALAKGIF